MQKTSIITAIFLSLLPFQVSAEVNCSVFDAIERIQFAQSRLSNAPANTFNSDDAVLVIEEVKRLDTDQIEYAHSGEISQTEAIFLVSYIQKTRELSISLKTRNQPKVSGYFGNPDFAPRQDRISRILPRVRCNQLATTGESNGGQRVTSSVNQVQTSRKITIVDSGILLALIVVGIAIAHRIYVIIGARNSRNKRRSKRYHTHLETQLSSRGHKRHGKILDISCNGAKVQIATEECDKIGIPIEVWIINNWHPAKISWLNTHYIGLMFDRPLQHAFIQTICSPPK